MLKFIFACIVGFCTATTSFACDLTLGVVPQFEHRRTLEIWGPLIEEFKDATGCDVTFATMRSIPEFEDGFRSGRFDIAYLNPYHAIIANDEQGYVPIVRSGRRFLQGILVVPNASDITDVSQLDGTTIAFPAPNALGASLLMRAELMMEHGISFKPTYVGTHTSSYLNAFKGLAAAGGGVQRTFNTQDEVLHDGLRILYKTTPVPSHPISVHPRVDPVIVAALFDRIIEISETHPEMLRNIPMQDPVATNIDDYQLLGDLGLEDFVE